MTRHAVWLHRAELAEPWRAPAAWQGDMAILTAAELGGLRLVLKKAAHAVLPTIQGVLYMCSQVCTCDLACGLAWPSLFQLGAFAVVGGS